MSEAPRLPLSRGARAAVDEVIKIFVGFQDALAPANEACDAVIAAMSKLKTGVLDESDTKRMSKAVEAVKTLAHQADRMALLEPLHKIILDELRDLP
jgi:hypothetical protein